MTPIKKKLKLRKVCMDDALTIWKWSNDPRVRAASFSSKFIAWEEHVRWLELKLNNSSCVFYIAVDNSNIPVGQIRFDIKGDCAIVSISIDEDYRGKGYGSILVRTASNMLFETSNVKTICAYIKPTNIVSINTFTNVNFKQTQIKNINGKEAVEYTLIRKDTK